MFCGRLAWDMIMWVVPFICGFSSSSVLPQGDLCSTICWQTDLFPAPSTSAPVASGDSVALSTVASGALNSLCNQITVTVAHMLHSPYQLSSLRFEQRTLSLQFPVQLLFPTLFPAQQWLLPAHFLPIQVHCCLAQSITVLIMASHVSSGSLDSKRFCVMQQGICGRPGSCTHSGKTGDIKLLAASLWNWLTYQPSISVQLT